MSSLTKRNLFSEESASKRLRNSDDDEPSTQLPFRILLAIALGVSIYADEA